MNNMKKRIIAISGKKQAGKCIVGNSIVFTFNGLKRISSICSSEEGYSTIDNVNLYDESGIGSTITSYFQKNCNTIKIISQAGYSLEGTGKHRVRVFSESGKIIWKKLKDISLNDYVIINRSGISDDSNNIDKKIKHNFIFNKKSYCESIKHEGTKKLVYSNMKKSKIPSFISMDLCRLMGYFLSEGSTYGNQITISNHNPQVLRDIKTAFINNFKIKPFERKDDEKCVAMSVNRVDLKYFFDYLGLNGKSENKHFSDFILSLPKQYLSEVLKHILKEMEE
jgi:intein/homing endonuclease